MELNVNNNVSFHISMLLRSMARQQTIAIRWYAHENCKLLTYVIEFPVTANLENLFQGQGRIFFVGCQFQVPHAKSWFLCPKHGFECYWVYHQVELAKHWAFDVEADIERTWWFVNAHPELDLCFSVPLFSARRFICVWRPACISIESVAIQMLMQNDRVQEMDNNR